MVALQLSAASGPVAELAAVVRAAEELGFEAVWIGEVNGVEAVAAATIAATVTETTGISLLLNVFTRSPTNVALALAAVAGLAPGRTTGVLGASSPLIVERWNGIPYRQPAARVRDYLEFVRKSSTGGRVDGRFTTFESRGFSLAEAPATPPQVFVAAAGPKMLELAASADGVVLNWIAPDDLDRLPVIGAGGDPGSVWISAVVCPAADRATVESIVRPLMADYLSAPAYAGLQRAVGRGPALEPMWEAFRQGDRRSARAALPGSVIDSLVVWGSPERCGEQLRGMEQARGVHAIATLFLEPGADYMQVLAGVAKGAGLSP